nr:MAG TPA: hypothetical protein [Caudoviricetes sp.]
MTSKKMYAILYISIKYNKRVLRTELVAVAHRKM